MLGLEKPSFFHGFLGSKGMVYLPIDLPFGCESPPRMRQPSSPPGFDNDMFEKTRGFPTKPTHERCEKTASWGPHPLTSVMG